MKDQLLALIEKYDSIVVFGHINPDGDCFGSQVGIKEIILENFPNKKVFIAGTGIKRFYKRLGNVSNVDAELISKSLAIIVDCSAFNRLEVSLAANAKAHIIFDHHLPSHDTIDCPRIIDNSKIAASEIIAEWALENNLVINKIAAEALFLGITTDSGGFKYKNTSSSTFVIASKLVATGFDFEGMYDVLHTSYEIDLKLQGFILSHYKKTKTGFIYNIFTRNDLKKLGLESNAAASRVNTLSNIEGYPVWGSFTEYPDGFFRVELRSKGFPIVSVALLFGGGGHANACGITRLEHDRISEVVDAVNRHLMEIKR